MSRFALLIVSLLTSTAALADGELKKSGTMKIDDGAERAASLHIGCSSDHNGVLAIELTVPDAYKKKDFDYDDFEGPDSSAGALSHIEWKTASKNVSITTKVAGSYIPDPPDAFVFGLNADSRKHTAAATLFAAFGNDAGNLVWTQSGVDRSKHKLVATFAFDATESARIRDITAACLPK